MASWHVRNVASLGKPRSKKCERNHKLIIGFKALFAPLMCIKKDVVCGPCLNLLVGPPGACTKGPIQASTDGSFVLRLEVILPNYTE